jgi:N-methylhydantoinase A
MRIHGQIWEIPVTCSTFPLNSDSGNDAIYLAFKTEYGRKYGDAMVGEMDQCDILNLRVVAHGIKPKPAMLSFEYADGADPRAAVKGRRRVFLPQTSEWQEIDVVNGAKLKAGMSFAGPLIVERKNTTIYVIPGSEIEIDRYHNCLMRIH